MKQFVVSTEQVTVITTLRDIAVEANSFAEAEAKILAVHEEVLMPCAEVKTTTVIKGIEILKPKSVALDNSEGEVEQVPEGEMVVVESQTQYAPALLPGIEDEDGDCYHPVMRENILLD